MLTLIIALAVGWPSLAIGFAITWGALRGQRKCRHCGHERAVGYCVSRQPMARFFWVNWAGDWVQCDPTTGPEGVVAE